MILQFGWFAYRWGLVRFIIIIFKEAGISNIYFFKLIEETSDFEVFQNKLKAMIFPKSYVNMMKVSFCMWVYKDPQTPQIVQSKLTCYH